MTQTMTKVRFNYRLDNHMNVADIIEDVDPAEVDQMIRSPDVPVDAFSKGYAWFKNATPADAIFPPGVPMTLVEIFFFYPHHVRWHRIFRRLVNNGVRPHHVSNIQSYPRDLAVKITTDTNAKYLLDTGRVLFGKFKFTSFKGQPTDDLRTPLEPGDNLLTRRKLVVPTYADLLKGLRCIPDPIEGGPLTQCILFWLENQHLPLTVRHTDDLYKALQGLDDQDVSMKSDQTLLAEWDAAREFATVDVPILQESTNATTLDAADLSKEDIEEAVRKWKGVTDTGTKEPEEEDTTSLAGVLEDQLVDQDMPSPVHTQEDQPMIDPDEEPDTADLPVAEDWPCDDDTWEGPPTTVPSHDLGTTGPTPAQDLSYGADLHNSIDGLEEFVGPIPSRRLSIHQNEGSWISGDIRNLSDEALRVGAYRDPGTWENAQREVEDSYWGQSDSEDDEMVDPGFPTDRTRGGGKTRGRT